MTTSGFKSISFNSFWLKRIFIVDHLNSNDVKNYTDHLKSENSVETKNPESKEKTVREFNDDEKEVEAILDQYIKPAVEGDGGAITLNYYKDNIVCQIPFQ